MKVNLNRQELWAVMRDADQIAPSHSPLEILRGALLEVEDGKMTVTAGNLETTLVRKLKAEVMDAGNMVINARLFTAMLAVLGGDVVTLESDGSGMVTITCDSTSYNVSVLSARDYPRMEIPFPEDTVRVSGIPAMAKRTVFAVAEEGDKPLMKCVNLIFSSDGLHAVGSDGFRVVNAKGESKSAGSVSMLMPAQSLDQLARLLGNKDELAVGTTGKSIVFTKEDFVFFARLMEGSYINVEQLLSQVRASFTVLTDTDALRTAVSTVFAVAEDTGKLMLRFGGGRLHLECTGECGRSSGELDVIPLSGTPQGEYWYNPRQLYECLRAQSGTLMVDVAQSGILILRSDELVCMQMAVRAPKAAECALPKAA
ncbi:MAG: DNA polymerase III subunit beta [Oscillospiraceae bacterium]